MMSDVAVEISMFERIGGALTIDRLVEGFYRRMDVGPEALFRRKGASAAAPAAYGLQNWRAGTRCVVALHEGRARRVCRGCRSPPGDIRFARKARRLDVQPGGQSP